MEMPNTAFLVYRHSSAGLFRSADAALYAFEILGILIGDIGGRTHARYFVPGVVNTNDGGFANRRARSATFSRAVSP